jgi:outer membrane protein insertion porin family
MTHPERRLLFLCSTVWQIASKQPYRRTAACLVLAAIGSIAAAQVSQFEGRPIVEIQFSPAQTLDAADLDKALKLHKGEKLRAQDVADSIDGLFATGGFEDIVAEAEASLGGVIVHFVTKNTQFVEGVTVAGKVGTPPSRAQAANAAQLVLGAPFHDDDLAHGTEAIKKLLEANGFYQAQVTPAVERSRDGQQVFIRFDVKEGKRAKYDMPEIHGETKLPDATILRATAWRLPVIHWWRQVTDARTHGGVQGVLNKYAKQDRLSARVELKRLDYDAKRRRVHPSLDITAGPKIKVKAMEAKVSHGVLKRYVPVFQEGAVDNDLLVEGQRNLRDYLQSQGYYDVDVAFRVQPVQNDLETIEYVISEGQRQKLAHVSIAGNKYFTAVDIRERMFMQPASFTLRHGRYSEAFRRKDEETIADLYRSNGFRDVRVTSAVDRNYKGKSGEIAVTLNIVEGPQWIVDKLTLEGIPKTERDALAAQLASSAGQPFAEADLAADRNQVLTYYYSHGFPDADFHGSWEPSAKPNHVNVVYTIAPGARQYVRGVLTSGLHHTRQSLLEKRITLQAGDPLSPVEQTEVQKRLYDLGIFARVDTAVENPDGDTAHKYVLYDIEEANRYTFVTGFGLQLGQFGTPSTTSVSAPAGSTGISPSVSLDINRLNFLGVGHTVTLGGMYSTLEQRGSLTYLVPHFLDDPGRSITYSVVYDNSLNVTTFASKREEGSVQLSQKFAKGLTGQFRFSYRRVSTSSVIIPSLLIPQLLQPVRIGILSTTFVQDRRDNPSDPHRGIYNTADIGIAGHFFGSERSFGRVLLRNATYYKLTKNLVLARQTQFGVIAPFAAPSGLSDQESVPLPERFFGGGADSLRAFPYNQAGPRDTGAPLVPGGPSGPATGFPLGGNALFFNNVELRFPLIGQNIQGVLFHDMGNVYSSLSNISLRFNQRNLEDFDYAVQAVGFGIRYRTPVGPIRLDLAYSINPPSFVGFQGTPAQLLQCGAASSCQSVQQSISHFQFFFSIGQTF